MSRPAGDRGSALLELRASIDELDDAIVTALNRRFALAPRVAEHKQSGVEDVAREKEVLSHVERLTRALGGDAAAIRSIYLLILEISVAIQHAYGDPTSSRAATLPGSRRADVPRYAPETADVDAYEREFWSTFGEAGICVFWGLSSAGLEQLDGPTRGRLVAFTHDVAFGDVKRRESLLGLVSGVPEEERMAALCRLVSLDGG